MPYLGNVPCLLRGFLLSALHSDRDYPACDLESVCNFCPSSLSGAFYGLLLQIRGVEFVIQPMVECLSLTLYPFHDARRGFRSSSPLV